MHSITKKIKPATVEKQILQHLKAKGIMLAWLARNINCSPGHLNFVLKGKGSKKRNLTQDNLVKINQALETSFELPA